MPTTMMEAESFLAMEIIYALVVVLGSDSSHQSFTLGPSPIVRD
jgi:hypothetical protein